MKKASWTLSFCRPPDMAKSETSYDSARGAWEAAVVLTEAGCSIETIRSPKDGVIDRATLERSALLERRHVSANPTADAADVRLHLLAASSRLRLAGFELERRGKTQLVTLLQIASALCAFVGEQHDNG